MAFSLYQIIKGLLISEEGTLTPKQIDITPGGTAGTKTSILSSQTTNKTLTLPDATDTLIGKATSDVLTNKTFNADGTGNSITNIENADIKTGAAIDAAKIHDGSVSNTEFSYLDGVSSSIQTQLNTNATGLSDHLADTVDAHDASAISFIPTGTIASSDVQSAVAEVATDAATNLATHEADTTNVHGITDTTLLSTPSNTQTFTNKSIDADTNTITNIDDNEIKAGAAINATKIANGNVSNTEFQFLDGVSSSIQTQLDNKQGLGNYITALTTDVVASGPGSVAATIQADAVTNTKLANMATQTIKGRTTAGTGDPEDLTATQTTAILNNFVGDSGSGGTKGLVPAPASGDAAANKYLKANGAWATVSASGGATPAVVLNWTGAQSIPPNSYTKLTIATPTFDVLTNFTNSTGTLTATTAGRYGVTFSWGMTNPGTALTQRHQRIAIYKNGSLYWDNGYVGGINFNGIENYDLVTSVSTILSLSVSDTLEAYVLHSDAGNVTSINAVRVQMGIIYYA